MLPASRNQTYGNDTPVAPADLNDIQDAIIARSHGDLVIPYPGGAWRGTSAFAPNTVGEDLTLGAITVVLPLVFPVGTRLKTMTIIMFGDGAADVTLTLMELNETGGRVDIGATAFNNTPAAYTAQVWNFADTIMIANRAYIVKAVPSASGLFFRNSYLTIDKP